MVILLAFWAIVAVWTAMMSPSTCIAAPPQAQYSVGVAKQDITPSYPVRLNGFGFRRTESEGVTQPIWAKALAIGTDDEKPLVLITLDSLGIRQSMVEEVARRLKERFGIERDRLAVTFSHSHTTPKVVGACDTIFSTPIPPEHQVHIEQYTEELTDAMEAVAVAALSDRKPSTLSWTVGKVEFAKNRRPQGGPVDHSLPVLVVKSADNGAIRAIYTTYACHCVTLSNNKISGDWAGFAQRIIESRHPDVIALTSIGCGSDANPDSGVALDNTGAAADQGTQIADEVDRLLRGPLKPIGGRVGARLSNIDLPLSASPDREQLQETAQTDNPAGYNAKFQLAKLDRGESLQVSLDYPIQSWEFGDTLVMVFLGGEVCVDYSVRLKDHLDPSRLWLHGYANDFCAYIPSERLLQEGGYGGGAEVVYFALPNALAPGLEEKIVDQVLNQVSESFRSKKAADSAADAQPWSLARAVASIETKPGFVVEPVATEPLVADPVAIDFAPDGHMWVAEMPDYSRFADEEFRQHGNVRRLTDVDGDGRFDESTVFADGLRFPTDVKSWRKGVIVCDAPDVIYLEDTNGDGSADVRKVLLTGFETHNAQARVNSLRWGLDNWLYGSCGLFGGTIRSATGKEITIGQRDFRFRPDTGEIEAVTGRTQQGRARNDWGDWFGCENESLLDHYPLDDRYFSRNPRLSPPLPEKPVAAAKSAKLHPIGQLTLFKFSGPPGRPTSVCGLDFYRDEFLGAEFTNNAFVAEPVNQLVHRLVLSPSGVTFTGRAADDEQDRAFLASSDPWFRPVQVRTGPDGCLYVVDMHRAVIEHPKFIPQESLRGLDVTAGREQGRIYRVRRAGVAPRSRINLTQLSIEQLVLQLESPNGTLRDQVHELIVERNDKSAVPRLQELARGSKRAATRLHALCALEALSGSNPDILMTSLHDEDAAVRRHAIRLSEFWLKSHSEVGTELLALVDDRDAKVRFQLACSFGEWDDERVAAALARMAMADHDSPYILAAVWSSVSPKTASDVLRELVESHSPGEIPSNVLEQAIRFAFDFQVADPQLIARTMSPDESGHFQDWQLDTARRLLVESPDEPAVKKCVAAALAFARGEIANDSSDASRMLAALRLVAAATTEAELAPILAPFLEPQRAPEIQKEAVALALTVRDPSIVDTLVAVWPGLAGVAREHAFATIASRKQHAERLLILVTSGKLAANSLDAAHRQRLLRHADAEIRAHAATALASSVNSDRDALVKDYLSKLDGGGAPDHGKQLFAKHCSTCHLLEGVGHSIGPDLAALSTRTSEGLVESILDPNRAVDDRFRCYTALTVDGLTYSGILAAETTNSVTLVDQQAEHTLLRADLDSLTMSELSLMPEGLERELGPTDFNDLLAYLTHLNGSTKRIVGNDPQVVKPGPDGVIALRASTGAIYGDEITFEPAWQNIGYWHGANDFVRWDVELQQAGEFEVYVDSACPADTSGNSFFIDGGSSRLIGMVAPTGGYDHYQLTRVGLLSLVSGQNSLVVRPNGALKSRNLMDLRAVYLAPAGMPLKELQSISSRPNANAAGSIALLVDKVATGAAKEYDLIPQIWQIAIAAGRRNSSEELIELLNFVVPRDGVPLADWRVVALGGGVINGLSQIDESPKRRLDELIRSSELSPTDWSRTLQLSAEAANRMNAPVGTRYDALRLLAAADLETYQPVIQKHLNPDCPLDLQIGAVETLADTDSAAASQMLLEAASKLAGESQRKAIAGLLRTNERRVLLASAIAAGRVSSELLTPAQRSQLDGFASATPARTGELSLGSIFGDHMVLQRDMRVPLWGKAAPGAVVHVDVASQSIECTADATGRWRLDLSPMPVGGPFDLTVTAGGSTEILHDVMVGEVWFAGGQSNMEWPVKDVVNGAQEVAVADCPQIRLIDVPNRYAYSPQDSFESASWKVCQPETVGDFSGVAYFFARHLQQELNVPIGIVECDFGGTMMEAWTDPQVLAATPPFDDDEQIMRARIANIPPGGDLGGFPKNVPGVLYNAMVSPVIPYGIRGVIWYQGENNAALHAEYADLSKLMIADWRTAWGQGDFPFLFVQLAGWEPGKDNWPLIREAQRLTAAQVPNVGMAVAFDLGDRTDIHPRNKQEVGRRLALLALAKVYGNSQPYSGPELRAVSIDGKRLRLSFLHADGGLAADGNRLRGFEVAASDGNFTPASATIEGDEVVVWSDNVQSPGHVRYAWSAFPDANLCNGAKLPAGPFQADVGFSRIPDSN